MARVTQRPVCTYDVVTGPTPEGLTPGTTFTHRMVKIKPDLARVLLDRRAPEVRRAPPSTLDAIVEELRSGDKPAVPMAVHIATTGETVAGCDFLEGLVLAGRWARTDVVHNVKLPHYIARKRHSGPVTITEQRAEILRELLRTPDERRCLQELAETLKRYPASALPMMRAFEAQGWVSSTRDGRYRWYRVTADRIDDIRAALHPPPSEPQPEPAAEDPPKSYLAKVPHVITKVPLTPARLGVTFALTPPQYAMLSELLLGKPGEPRWVHDLCVASGTRDRLVRSMIDRLVSAQWALEWYEDETAAAREKRLARRYVQLTEAGAAEAHLALQHHKPPAIDDVEQGDPVDTANQLGGLLLLVQNEAGATGARVAEIAKRSQSWWSKVTMGRTRSVDIDALRRITVALSPPEWQSEQIIALAKALNAAGNHPRHVFSPASSRMYAEWEHDSLRVAKDLAISSPDAIPVQLWCDAFTEAMASGLSLARAEVLWSTVSQWRSRVDNGRVRITWAVGEAALYRTYGFAPEVMAAQLKHMERLTSLSARGRKLLLGVVPFDAEIRTSVPAFRIINKKRAVLDLATGLVTLTGAEVPQLVQAFEALPTVWADEADELLRRAQAWHCAEVPREPAGGWRDR